MLKKITTLVRNNLAFTGVVFALGGIAALSFGGLARLLAPASDAIKKVTASTKGSAPAA